MNKKLMSMAVASAMVLPMANANAEGMVKAYGAIHQAFQRVQVGSDTATYTIDGTSAKANKLGLKGSVDTNLMDAVAIYQFEMGLNAVGDTGTYGETGNYFQRDTWAGLTSKTMGTIRGGTIATVWKSNSVLVDPLFTTALEARGSVVGGESSNLAGGLGTYRGRATHTVRYDSPSFSGVKVGLNYSFHQGGANPLGLGVTWKNRGMAAFFNYQSTNKDAGTTLSAMKLGGKAMFGAFGVSGSYAIDNGAIGGHKDDKQNKLYLAGTYGMGATTFILNFGMSSETTSGAKDDSTGFGLTVKQQLAKKVAVYAGYGQRTGGANAVSTGVDKKNALAIGMIAKF